MFTRRAILFGAGMLLACGVESEQRNRTALDWLNHSGLVIEWDLRPVDNPATGERKVQTFITSVAGVRRTPEQNGKFWKVSVERADGSRANLTQGVDRFSLSRGDTIYFEDVDIRE